MAVVTKVRLVTVYGETPRSRHETRPYIHGNIIIQKYRTMEPLSLAEMTKERHTDWLAAGIALSFDNSYSVY